MKTPSWASKVRTIRRRGWKFRQIGERIGIGPSGVHDILTGRTKEPNGMTAVLLHDLFLQRETPPK